MNSFLIIIIAIYLLLCPFYIFPSGQPQPADFIIAFGAVVFLFSKKFREVIKEPVIKKLFSFVLLVVIINTLYSGYYYAIIGLENRIFFTSTFYVFNAIFFLIVLSMFLKKTTKRITNTIALLIIISLAIQCTLALMGIQGGEKEEVSRPTIFFNNPNQLGYHAILMMTFFAILPSMYRKSKLFSILTIAMSAYLVLYSGSRAALAAVLLLSIIIFYKENMKIDIKSITVIIIITALLPTIYQSDFVQKRVEQIEVRGQRHIYSNVSEAQIRGYDRLWIYPEYIFYGAGEGEHDRFDSYHQMEIHSGIATVLFSYGILGLFLFLSFLYTVIRQNTIFNIIVLLPVLIYNMTHQGFRTSLFWGVLAAMYCISIDQKKY